MFLSLIADYLAHSHW